MSDLIKSLALHKRKHTNGTFFYSSLDLLYRMDYRAFATKTKLLVAHKVVLIFISNIVSEPDTSNIGVGLSFRNP